MTFDLRKFPWRRPMMPDWKNRFAEIEGRLAARETGADNGEPSIAQDAQTLANQRLGPLELVKTSRLATKLWADRDKWKSLRPFRVALVGNRTLSFLAASLPAAALARGILLDVLETEFDSAAALAMGSDAFDTGGPVDATLLMLDEGAFAHAGALLDQSAETQDAKRAEALLEVLTDGLRTRFSAPVIVTTIPLRPESAISSSDLATPGAGVRFVDALNRAIIEGVEAGKWLVWNMAELASELGTQIWFDQIRHFEAKAPFAVELSALAADHLCRVVAAMTGKSGRALVLDLDNTLWGGVIGDDGVAEIRLGNGSAEGEAYLAVQRMALDLRARGVVLAVCSKNDDAIARAPFGEHPDMLLKLEHIAVFQCNWSDKASNLKAIAESLNLGLGSLVFVDDNPAERERVRQELPTVIVPELDCDPAYYPRTILASGAFEHLKLNTDDVGRAASYSRNADRIELRERLGNYEDYLRSLEMKMTISRFDAAGRARIAQLINKSNQFNLTTRRYNDVDVAAFEADKNALCWQVRLSDTFGDHGMIGVVIVKRESAQHWVIDSWLMSCRVLKRGVEQTLMNELVARARSEGVRSLEGIYVRTERNGLVAGFYEEMQFTAQPSEPQSGDRRYSRSLEDYVPFVSQILVATT
jgi:FkbH-like protein